MSDNTVRNFFFNRMDGMTSLRKGLDAYSLRQKVQASNIANSETPNYMAKQVKFEDALSKALNRSGGGIARTNSDHIASRNGLKKVDKVQARVENSDLPPNFNGVNNVDIDREMSSMATNQIHFGLASKILSTRYKMIRSSIMGQFIR